MKKIERLDSMASTISFHKDYKPTTLVQLAKDFFKQKEIIWLNDIVKPQEVTYRKNKITGKLVTQRTGHKRSVEDFYLLAKTYIPNISYIKCQTLVDEMKNNNVLMSSWCYTVKRMVHIPMKNFKSFKSNYDIKID